ncbi:MAG TPA: hypothetical protein PKM25_06845 [Candidatus Ozemobacteraceae bacterium]|nr:hypothetical protein [Candidatus Ozemobacteraceae bacterium]
MRYAHRGAYEHLWAEHRYSVVGLSIKHSKIACGKLGRTPHFLSFLGFLARHRNEPRRGLNHAMLSVYDHLQPHLDRIIREKLIESVLNGDPATEEMLYERICLEKSVGLYGCRLFFPARGFNKFWDYGEQPGLQVLLGPRMVHVPFDLVRTRLEFLSGMQGAGLNERLVALKHGVTRGEYDTWPELLRMALEDHLMVAVMPTRATLHPRVELPLPQASVQEVEPMHAALLALERLWDANTDLVPHLPSADDWRAAMSPDRLSWASPIDSAALDTALAMISEEFADQLNLESGKKICTDEVQNEAEETVEDGRDEGSEDREGDFPGIA